jgi:hypothetical protein
MSGKVRTPMSIINTVTQPRLARPHRRTLRWIVGIVAGVVLLLAAGFGFMVHRMNYIPSDLDLSTTRLSNNSVYQVSYAPRRGPIAINQLHAWTLHVETPDGQPVTDATITVDGDMPQHGHGLPTRPQVTRHLGNGDYLVEGMKFQMGGWWVVDFTVDAHGQQDSVRFNMVLR